MCLLLSFADNETPQNMDELRYLPRNINLENSNNGLLELNKLPTSLRATDRIVGIDPGIKCILNMCSAISSYNFYDFLGQREEDNAKNTEETDTINNADRIRTIVAFGDASVRFSMPGNPSLPQKVIILISLILSQRILTINLLGVYKEP